jgi:hypothetical protein
MPERLLAVIDFENGYSGLVDAMRARANEMAIAVGGASAAEISGLPSSYLAKLLSPSPKPARRFGAISLGPVLGVLGLKLVVMTDEKAEKKFGSKLERRQEKCAHHTAAVNIRLTHKFLREIAAKGGANSRRNMTRRQASALAKSNPGAMGAGAQRQRRGRMICADDVPAVFDEVVMLLTVYSAHIGRSRHCPVSSTRCGLNGRA